MSALGGICNFDGAPIEEALLDRLSRGLRSRGPDGCRSYIGYSIGLVYRSFHTTRESRAEIQPLISPNGVVVVCWDGRLDNREELTRLLSDDLRGDSSDAALVLAAYLRWGADCWPRLIGDYATAIWDHSISTLLLARDPFGSRPLYYQSSGSRLVWSSLLEALLDLPGACLRVSDEYVADYFALCHDPALTPYEDISAVEPGHVVRAANGRIQSHIHWKPDPGITVCYESDEDYEDHFRHLFREAVRSRLRVDGPVWADLSGGLDSSSIVCMADQILAEGAAEATELRTASYVDDAKSFDDGEFIPLMEQSREQKGYHLRLADYWLVFPEPKERAIVAPSAATCSPGLHAQLCREMRNCGARVLLSGLGGDQVLWNSKDPSPLLADLASLGKLKTLHDQIEIWSRVLKETYPRVLWRNVLLPLLPRKVRGACLSRDILAPWLNRKFARQMQIRDRCLLPPDPYGFALPSMRMHSSMLVFVVSTIASGEVAQSDQVDIAYPFLHRPLVEFLMTIPFEQKLRPGEIRSIQRRALDGVVPERVLRRKTKGAIGEVICRGLIRERPRVKSLFTDARVCARGYVNGARLQEALDKALHGVTSHLGMLVTTIAIEIWLRSLECGAAEAFREDASRVSQVFISYKVPEFGIRP